MTSPRIYPEPSSAPSALSIPPLASIIRYHDEFSEQEYAVEPQLAGDVWEVVSEGMRIQLDFTVFSEGLVRDLVKLVIANCLATMRSSSAAKTWSNLKGVAGEDILALVAAVPHDASFIWEKYRTREWHSGR